MNDERPPLEPADEEELRSAAALARALEGGGNEPDLPQGALETAALLRLSACGAELAGERRDAIRKELLDGLPARSERRRRPLLPEWARTLPRWLFLALPLGGTAVVCSLLLVKGPAPEARFDDGKFADRSFAEQKVGAGEAGELARAARVPARSDEASPLVLPPGAVPGATERRGDSYATGAPEASEAAARAVAAAPAEQARGMGAVGSLAAPAQREAMKADGALALSGAPAGNRALLAGQPSARAALVGLDKDVRAERTQLLARSNDAELSRAHAELDGAQSRAQIERSQANLTRLLATAGDGLGPDDARQVRQDLYCRLAETALRLGEPRTALDWTRRGIDLDGPPSPFLAQLMALEGDALAALGEPSSAAGSYMRALHVHEALLDESLDGH